MKAVGYTRVSTQAQGDSGLGIAAQNDAIKKAAEARGWDLRTVYEDVASGKAFRNRPGLANALAALSDGKADALIVAKLDRLARSVTDGGNIIRQARDENWALVICDIQLDTATPMGAFGAHIMLAFAELERSMISQRTKEAKAIAKLEGRPTGGRKKGEFWLPVETRQLIFRLRAEGLSYDAITARLNSDGVPTAFNRDRWWKETVRKIVLRGE